MLPNDSLWTIGHSNQSIDDFIGILLINNIQYVVDVRSYPYSKYVPHFNKENLIESIKKNNMFYIFMGTSLGGRPRSNHMYDENSRALYSEMSKENSFITSIDRLVDGVQKGYRVAIMCSCGKEEHCHRRLLVGKAITNKGLTLNHIQKDGSILGESFISISPENWKSFKPIKRYK